MRLSARLFAALVLLTAASAAAAADEAYAVRIERPWKAGDTYDMHVVVESTRTSRVKIAGKDPIDQDESVAGEITGRVEVKEVDAVGSEKTLTLTVAKLTAGPDHKEAVAAGKVIEVKRSTTDVTFALQGGGALGDDAQKVLAQLYHKLNASPVTDDDVFGSKTPRKAGDSWPVDADAAARQASGADIQVDAKKLSGRTTLKGVETAAGKPALRLTTELTINDLSGGDMPAGASIESSQVKGTINVLLPVDPAQPCAERESTTDTTLVIRMAGDNPATIDVKGRQYELQTIVPVKK